LNRISHDVLTLDSIFPMPIEEHWPALESLHLANIAAYDDDIVLLLSSLPSLEHATLNNVLFYGSATNLPFIHDRADVLKLLRWRVVDHNGRWASRKPLLVIRFAHYQNLPWYQIYDESITAFLYGSGINPFGPNVSKATEPVGWILDEHDPRFRMPIKTRYGEGELTALVKAHVAGESMVWWTDPAWFVPELHFGYDVPEWTKWRSLK
jgi:hypothetical protein